MAEKTRGIKIEQGPKRVRAHLAGEVVAATKKIAGLACFYNEKVDITLDGERQERLRTHFS
jgi:uncharacterized protein (DUF427 family)